MLDLVVTVDGTSSRVEGARCVVAAAAGAWRRELVTGRDGSARLRIDADVQPPLSVTVSPPGILEDRLGSVSRSVAPHEVEGPVSIALLPQSSQLGRVAGRVEDPAGQPIAGAEIASGRSGAHLSALSGEDGRFEMVVVPRSSSSTATLSASARGYLVSRDKVEVHGSGAVRLVLHPDRTHRWFVVEVVGALGEPAIGASLTLARVPELAATRPSEEHGVLDPESHRIAVSRAATRRKASVRVGEPVLVDASGEVEIPYCPKGTLEYVVLHDQVAYRGSFEVGALSSRGTVVVGDATTLRGRVTHAGVPVEGADIRIDGVRGRRATTAVDGSFSLPVARSADTELVVRVGGREVARAQTDGLGESDELVVTLPPHRVVRCSVSVAREEQLPVRLTFEDELGVFTAMLTRAEQDVVIAGTVRSATLQTFRPRVETNPLSDRPSSDGRWDIDVR